MTKRVIEPEWVERVIQNSDLRLDDDNDPELEHRLAKVPELANRVLRVIVSKSEPRRVVSLYPDRNMKGKLWKIDREADALYLDLDESLSFESQEIAPGVILDYNKEGKVVGIEMLYLSKRFDISQLKKLEVEPRELVGA